MNTIAWTSKDTFQVSLYTQDTLSGESGLRLGELLDQEIQKRPQEIIFVSLKGIEVLTPSFVNGSFIYLIDVYGEDYIRQYIKVIEGRASVINALRLQLQSHIEHRRTFTQKVAAYKIYCGIDNSAEGANLRYRLYEMSNKDRFLFNSDDARFNQETKNKIQESDGFIGFVTSDNAQFQAIVLEEANYAVTLNKPTLLMLRKGVQIRVPQEIQHLVQLVYYTDDTVWQLLADINRIILSNQAANAPIHKDKSFKYSDVLAWSALGLGAAALIALLFDDK